MHDYDLKLAFGAACTYKLELEGWGGKKKCAQAAGISPGYLGEIAAGKKRGDENVRRAIASYFGDSYEDFLTLGRKVLAGEIPENSALIGTSLPHAASLNATPAEVLLQELRDVLRKAGLPTEGDNFMPATPTSSIRQVPILSWVQAGEFTTIARLEVDDFTASEVIKPGVFALRVKGYSMAPDFLPGDIIVVDPTGAWGVSDFVVARNGNEATFKQLKQNDQGYYLHPLNSEGFEDTPIENADTIIVGRVIEHNRRRRF